MPADPYKDKTQLVFSNEADCDAALIIHCAPCDTCELVSPCVWDYKHQRPDGKFYFAKHPVASRMTGITGVYSYTEEEYNDSFEN